MTLSHRDSGGNTPQHNGGVRSWTDSEVADLHRFLDDATAERDRYEIALRHIADAPNETHAAIMRRMAADALGRPRPKPDGGKTYA